jgi:cytoskeletal protein RodZ
LLNASGYGVESVVALNRKVFSSFLNFWRRRIPIMKSFNLVNFARAIVLALTLGFAPFAMQALAQGNNSTTTTQSSPSTTTTTQSNPTTQSSSQTTKQTSSSTEAAGINPLYLIIGGIALLAILLIVLLSARGRSRGGADTTYKSKTVVKKD